MNFMPGGKCLQNKQRKAMSLHECSGMVLTSQDTKSRTVSLPLYDPTPGSTVSLGQPNVNYDPQDGTFITVTNGAGANAPSESLGYYFGGLYNADGAKYSYFLPPTNQSDWLISVTMEPLGHAVWAMSPVPENITWRAEAGLVWVPTSSKGILIAIGGVVKPADLNFNVASDNATESHTFLQEFPVYDIGSNTWSVQQLNPGSPVPPKALAQFCTTVASSADGSHHDIFVYGGWDSNGGEAQSDVWILSVPSFTWIQATPSGRKGTARQNHVCVSPYEDQMIVIGGTGTGEELPIYENSVDVFNLNTFNWTGTYDPEVHDTYKPNAAVASIVKATPTASNLQSVVSPWFQNKYDMTKIQSFGPFQAVTTESSAPNNGTNGGGGGGGGGGGSNRDWVIPVAVVVPIAVIALIAGLIFLRWRKVKKDQRRQEEMAQTQAADNRERWIVPWIWSTSGGAAHKDHQTDSSVTEVERFPQQSPPMQEVAHHELDAGGNRGYFVGSSNAGDSRERWSHSTQVRSPRYDYAGPVEGMNTEVHEVDGSARVSGPEDINYEFRNMAMYPPSVVSGGAGGSRTMGSSAVSQSGDSVTPASPQSHSVVTSSGFAPIHENQAAQGHGHTSAYRAISPIDLRGGDRPHHQRNQSDVSDIGTSPLPSPNLEADDDAALPGRRVVSRSVSGDDIDEAQHPRAL